MQDQCNPTAFYQSEAIWKVVWSQSVWILIWCERAFIPFPCTECFFFSGVNTVLPERNSRFEFHLPVQIGPQFWALPSIYPPLAQCPFTSKSDFNITWKWIFRTRGMRILNWMLWRKWCCFLITRCEQVLSWIMYKVLSDRRVPYFQVSCIECSALGDGTMQLRNKIMNTRFWKENWGTRFKRCPFWSDWCLLFR